MQLTDLSIENLHIPFKVVFQHASASRSCTEAILVKATTSNGKQGLGEGCPRKYVTGETLETAHQFFNAYWSDFLAIQSLDDLKSWIEKHQRAIDKNPAAFCAVELALLNALAEESLISIESLLSLPELSGQFHYTAVLGLAETIAFHTQLQQYLKTGFSDFKIKLFGIPKIDKANIDALKGSKIKGLRLRVDANNLWSNASDAIHYIKHLKQPIFAIEEPLAAYQYTDFIQIHNELKVKIILDESFTKESDFKHLQSQPTAWVINLRISKMGGILRSLNIVNQARINGIPIIIGAQVGETSVLTRAAITVANASRDLLLAQEGAFGTHLLEQDINESIKFGQKGIVNSADLKKRSK